MKGLKDLSRIVPGLFLCFHSHWLLPTSGKMAAFHVTLPCVAVGLNPGTWVLWPCLRLVCVGTQHRHRTCRKGEAASRRARVGFASQGRACVLQGYWHGLAYSQWLRAPRRHDAPAVLGIRCAIECHLLVDGAWGGSWFGFMNKIGH